MSQAPAGGERAVLVHLQLKREKQYDVQEFQELAHAAGATVAGTLTCQRDAIHARYCIGTGKLEELKSLLLATKTTLVLFDHNLSPSQEKNLEQYIQARVLGRTGLILDIFAARARTHEGKLQVELAQLQYHSTRLVRGWTHLERQKGGIGLRGPGETQLEVDRRLIRQRIKQIKAKLEKVRKQRNQGRQARKKADVPTIALVGYTNAGKSTLFNKLTNSEVYTADQLFATLDPTLRVLALPALGEVILADTVGFIRQLPHNLVEAFRATLEEINTADLLLHVIDSQDESRENRIQEVLAVLSEIGALDVPSIEVYNKIDLAPDVLPQITRDENGIVRRVFVSAKEKLGFTLLGEAIVERLNQEMVSGEICLPTDKFKERASLFALGGVRGESTAENGDALLQIRLPRHKWQQLCFHSPDLVESWKQIDN